MTTLRLPHLRRLTRVLAALCLAFVAVIAVELAAGGSSPLPPDPSPTRTRAAAPKETAGFSLPPASSYDEIVTRPLFSDTRRPSAFSTASADAHPNFVLVGTVLSSTSRDALIRHGQPARVDHVAEGQTLDGWTVQSIEPDRVIFANAGANLEVTAKNASIAAAPPRERRGAGEREQPSNLTSVPNPANKE